MEDFQARLAGIVDRITLADNFYLHIGRDEEVPEGRYYFQIQCWRKDVITDEMGWGYGGKYYLSPHATTSELVQTVWGAYQAYWLHEARETFQWKGRRVFGPHISVEALYEAAPHVDIRSARHVEDRAGAQASLTAGEG